MTEQWQIYRDFVLSFWLGQWGRSRITASIAVARSDIAANDSQRAPLLSWYIFEGLSLPLLGGSLASQFDKAWRLIRQLQSVHRGSPRERQMVTGEIDWQLTAQACASNGRPTFVCTESTLGLTDAEQEALHGWMSYIGERWATYRELCPDTFPASVPWSFVCTNRDPPVALLRRWATASCRSRWPFLRTVVTATLRCAFDPPLLTALPLSIHPGNLFQMYCLTKALHVVEQRPNHVRWAHDGGFRYASGWARNEWTVERESILKSDLFSSELLRAIIRDEVLLPSRIDGFVEFDHPINGFNGILIEAKSGGQTARDTLLQLLCYRAALRRRYTKLLVIGAIEGASVPRWSCASVNEDAWYFVPASEIDGIVRSNLNYPAPSGQ